jgi:hypothetical protein
MSEQTATETEQQKSAPEIHSFLDVLRSLKGKIVTVANPESLEDSPMGYQLTTSVYKAKVLGVGNDFVTLACELARKGRDAVKEPVKQFVPLERVKRVSVAKSEVIVHI